MGRKKCKKICRTLDKAVCGLIIIAVGIAIIAVVALPFSVWIALIGCFMIYIGYKLFI